MMNTQIFSMYCRVCDAPSGSGVSIDRLPELIASDPDGNRQQHTHSFYEIIWFQEDGGVHTVDFQDYPIRRNTLVLLAPGQVHHFDDSTPPKGYAIKICSDFCDSLHDTNDAVRHSLFYSPDGPCMQLDDDAAPVLEQLICSIEDELHNSRKANHREMLSLFLRMLLIHILRYTRRAGEHFSDNLSLQQALYIRFRNMLEEEFMHLHLVGEYAQHLGVSSKTLTNAVRAATGQTPMAIINDRIVLESKRLLRFSNLMVKEISYQLGFDEPSNFVKFFKRHTGHLPGEYQKAEETRFC